MGEQLSQAWIIEWASPPFSHPQVLVLELMLGLMLVLALGTARPIPWRDLVVLVPLVHLGLQATRNTPLLVIVATPILGRAVASCAGAHWARLGGSRPPRGRGGGGGLVLSACSMVAGSRQPAQVWSAFRPTFGVADTLPAGAAEFLRREGRRGTLWNEYVWGGFLIWHLYPELRVSIDGRMAVYGPARFSEHLAVSELTARVAGRPGPARRRTRPWCGAGRPWSRRSAPRAGRCATRTASPPCSTLRGGRG